MSNSTIYEKRGVTTEKTAVSKAIAKHNPGLFPGAFCKILPDYLAGDPECCVILHADGVGTKIIIAYLFYKRKLANASVFRKPIRDSLVMNFDDMACVGATGPFLVSTTIGRNKFFVPDEVIAAIIGGCEEYCDFLTKLGLPCYVGGGETADLPDLEKTITVDNTIICRMKRSEVIDASRIVPGDVIVGFSSTGQTSYEDEENSGIGSNGFTNARHDLLNNIQLEYPEVSCPQMPAHLTYRGKFELTDALPGAPNFTIGSALLSPTRTYLPLIQYLLPGIPHAELHGLIHCSGGGQTKIKKFGPESVRYVKDDLFPTAPIFKTLQRASGMTWREMHEVYNMGHRLEAVLPEKYAGFCIQTAKGFGIKAKVVGHVEKKGKYPRLTIRNSKGVFNY